MAHIVGSLRDHVVYGIGYLKGRSSAFPTSFTELYGNLVARITSLIALPLPFLSFLALPFFGGSSTAINLVFFYLIWSALVLAHGQLWLEFWGTLAVRSVCFVLPALASLMFDCLSPSTSRKTKAHGRDAHPSRLGRDALLRVTGVALFNVFLGVAVQVLLEALFTSVLHLRSILRVSSVVPMPLNIFKHAVAGFAWRGVIHYFVHRYLLHHLDSPLQRWHLRWQHAVLAPFPLVAAYDHPVNYLLAQWLPTFVPALLIRFHVLTWLVFVALVSFEELFVNSGYSVLPSTIILTGMARRTDEHFLSVSDSSKRIGNFGHWGVLDLVFRTTCNDENDVSDDIEAEASKHRLRNHFQNAVEGAASGFRDVPDKESKPKRRGRKRENA